LTKTTNNYVDRYLLQKLIAIMKLNHNQQLS